MKRSKLKLKKWVKEMLFVLVSYGLLVTATIILM